MDLDRDGFDPNAVKDPLFFYDENSGFVPITPELRDKLTSGAVRV
jgi:hypothetical protein